MYNFVHFVFYAEETCTICTIFEKSVKYLMNNVQSVHFLQNVESKLYEKCTSCKLFLNSTHYKNEMWDLEENTRFPFHTIYGM